MSSSSTYLTSQGLGEAGPVILVLDKTDGSIVELFSFTFPGDYDFTIQNSFIYDEAADSDDGKTSIYAAYSVDLVDPVLHLVKFLNESPYTLVWTRSTDNAYP